MSQARSDAAAGTFPFFKNAAQTKRFAPSDFAIIPTTFILPDELALFREHVGLLPEGKDVVAPNEATWLMKLSYGSDGKGIYLRTQLFVCLFVCLFREGAPANSSFA